MATLFICPKFNYTCVMKIIITGIAGTGKTTVLSELQKYGYVVIDLDATGMCIWKNIATGEITEYGPTGRDQKWINEHGWYCNIETLKKLLSCIREDKDIFVAGVSENIEEVVAEFDKVFFLNASDDVIKQRLLKRTNNHFGKKEDEQEAIFAWRTELMNKIKNFTEVDASKSPNEIAEFILGNLRK